MDLPKSLHGQILQFEPCNAFDPYVGMYNLQLGPILHPYEFSGWQDETMSWKETCYIHSGLYPNSVAHIIGPDCVKLMAAATTSSHEKFAVGRCKHAVLTDDEGRVLTHGLSLRIREDEIWTYSLSPYLEFEATKHDLNVKIEDWSTRDFNFQCGGPRVLEMLEAATGDDLHDIPFMGHRESSINGKPVRILRMGMAGTLAYEVHGNAEDAAELYQKVYEAGQAYGVRRIGWLTYSLNHTENGFPQVDFHFSSSCRENNEFVKYLDSLGYNVDMWPGQHVYLGSSGQEERKRWRNPVELNFQNSIGFNHDFRGKAVIEELYHNPKRATMTLVWNLEDITEVFLSQFRKGEAPYNLMEFPFQNPFRIAKAGIILYQDDVFDKDGKLIGYSSCRQYSNYSRDMFSLGTIDIEYTKPGTEVYVLWGEPGTRQMKVRATVAPFPHLDLTPNSRYDVETIPHINKK